MMMPPALLTVLFVGLAGSLAAQVPAPFPRPGQQPAAPRPQNPPVAAPVQPPAAALQPGETPGESVLGVPIYPSAQYLESYDAGRGQRFHIFGTESDFAQIVAFYKNVLKQRGDSTFEEPPVHMFELGKFREETMGFPPSVTVKDYTWGGSQGYLNPRRGGAPMRFRTIIQVVPAPAAAAK